MTNSEAYKESCKHVEAIAQIIAEFCAALPIQSADWLRDSDRDLKNTSYHLTQSLFFMSRIYFNSDTSYEGETAKPLNKLIENKERKRKSKQKPEDGDGQKP